jgi:pSer/pThr/pTyr-binding forkhead associated (FHA) protein
MSEPYWLTKVSDGKQVGLKDDLVVGRHPECGLQLNEGFPSRRHARLVVVENTVWVEDLGSRNGTFVNGVRIAEKTRVNAGDRLRFDIEEYDLHSATAPQPAPTGEETQFRPISSLNLPPKEDLPPPPREQVNQPVKEPVKEPAKEVVAEASGVYQRPGAWADPDAFGGGENKTKYIPPEALKAMISDSGAASTVASGEEVDAPYLVVASGSKQGTRIKLHTVGAEKLEWTVGSHADREIVLEDSGVSALHAKIVNAGERWKVLDQISANGTFVNSNRVNISFLSSGDRLRFGPVECIFQLPTARDREDASGKKSSLNKALAVGAVSFVVVALVLFAVYHFVLSK